MNCYWISQLQFPYLMSSAVSVIAEVRHSSLHVPLERPPAKILADRFILSLPKNAKVTLILEFANDFTIWIMDFIVHRPRLQVQYDHDKVLLSALSMMHCLHCMESPRPRRLDSSVTLHGGF